MNFMHCVMSRDKTPLMIMGVQGRPLTYVAELIGDEMDILRFGEDGTDLGGLSMPYEVFDGALELLISFGKP